MWSESHSLHQVVLEGGGWFEGSSSGYCKVEEDLGGASSWI